METQVHEGSELSSPQWDGGKFSLGDPIVMQGRVRMQEQSFMMLIGMHTPMPTLVLIKGHVNLHSNPL